MRPDGFRASAHYLLDHLGSCVVAASWGTDPGDLGWRKANALAITTSPRLAHLTGCKGVFCGLAATARRDASSALLLWWSEGRFASWWEDETVPWPAVDDDGPVRRPRPDGYGVWRDAHGTVGVAVEYDRGTEPLRRLTAKLAGYVELAWLFGAPAWTLFVLPSPRREATARAALDGSPVPVATTHEPLPPGGPVWLPLGVSRRVPLGALATVPDTPPVAALRAALTVPGARSARRRVSRSGLRGLPEPSPCAPSGSAPLGVRPDA